MNKIVTDEALGKMAELQKGYIDNKFAELDPSNGYEFVDMGEAGIWAKYPIGVSNWETCLDNILYFEYGGAEGYKSSEVQDGIFNGGDLDIDTARINMGGNWVMPSKEAFQKLCDLCNSEWVTDYNGISGLNGILFKLKTNEAKELFVPAVGYCDPDSSNDIGTYGYFWASTLAEQDPFVGNYLDINSEGASVKNSYNNHIGYCVLGFLGYENPEKYLTKKEAKEIYQPKGDYATKKDLESKADNSEVVKGLLINAEDPVYTDPSGTINIDGGKGIKIYTDGYDINISADTDILATKDDLNNIDLSNYPTKSEAQSYADKVKNDILGDDLESTFDTLKAVQDWADEHGTEYAELVQEVEKKATKEEMAAAELTLMEQIEEKADKVELEGVVYGEEVVDEDTFEEFGKVTREELKLDLLVDMWLARGNYKGYTAKAVQYSSYDPSRAPYSFGLNELWMTAEEAIQILMVPNLDLSTAPIARAYGFQYAYGNLIRTMFPLTGGLGINLQDLFTAYTYVEIEIVRFLDYYSKTTNDSNATHLLNTANAFRSANKLRKWLGIYDVGGDGASAHFNAVTWPVLEELYLKNVKKNCTAPFRYSNKVKFDCLRFLVDNAANTTDITVTVHKDIYNVMTGETSEDLNGGTAEQWQQLALDAASKNITFATV